MASSLTSVFAGLGITISAAFALKKVITDTANLGDELNKMSQKTGVSVEKLSELKYAADLSDVSLEGLSTGLKKLSMKMAEVAKDSEGEAAKAFKALGVSVTDANGKLKSTDIVLAEVADKFAEANDGAAKTAIAIQIFGRSGADMIPLLNSGAQGLRDMGKEARDAGLVMSAETAKKSEELNDNLRRLKLMVDGVAVSVGSELIPEMNRLSESFVKTGKEAADTNIPIQALGAVFKGLFQAIDGVISGLKMAFWGLGSVVFAVSGGIGIGAEYIWDVLSKNGPAAQKKFAENTAWFKNHLKETWAEISEISEAYIDRENARWGGMMASHKIGGEAPKAKSDLKLPVTDKKPVEVSSTDYIGSALKSEYAKQEAEYRKHMDQMHSVAITEWGTMRDLELHALNLESEGVEQNFAKGKITDEQRIAHLKDIEQRIYDVKKFYLEEGKQLEKDPAKIAAQQAEIEALTHAHEVRLAQMNTETLKKQRSTWDEYFKGITSK